jgi:DNA mismatch endonuclease (patch repair protein)
MDVVTQAQRSAMMAGIRGRDTGPEMAVRRAVHRLGFRYRLHGRDLPGTPDLVFPRLHTVLFVHGCFWHRHTGCRLAYEPKSNVEFWRRKFAGNVARDSVTTSELRDKGWEVLTVWECEVREAADLSEMLERRLAHATH